MALHMLQANCVFIAPYCPEHADEAIEAGASYATGPALAEEARPLEGKQLVERAARRTYRCVA